MLTGPVRAFPIGPSAAGCVDKLYPVLHRPRCPPLKLGQTTDIGGGDLLGLAGLQSFELISLELHG